MSRLTSRQRQTLLFMLNYRDETPSASGLVVANWWRYLILVAYFALVGTGVGIGLLFGHGYLLPIGCAFGGVLVGVLLQNFAQLNATANVWPVTREVIDWQKVQQLLDDDASTDEEPGT